MKLSPGSHHGKKMLVSDKASPHAYYKDRNPAFYPKSREQLPGLPTRMSCSSSATGHQSQSLSSLGRSGCGIYPQGHAVGLWRTTHSPAASLQ